MALTLDQATSLEHVGDTLYVGFNDDLTRVSFPKLKTIGGALIIESNPALKELHFPALESIGKYLHVHDCLVVVELVAPRLRAVGGDVSLVSCPRLATVRMGSAAQPATTTNLEVKGLASPVLPGLHVTIRG
jgi:hypothetical protein